MLKYVGDLEKLKEFGFERFERRVVFSDYFRGYKRVFRRYVDYKIEGIPPKLVEETTITIHDKDSTGFEREIYVSCTTDTCAIESLKIPQVIVGDEALIFLYELIRQGLVKNDEQLYGV